MAAQWADVSLFFWVTMNVVSSILQFIALPLWISALPEPCSDPFVVFQVASVMFVLFFGTTVACLSAFNGNSFAAFLRQLTWRGIGLIVLTGLIGALNGIFVTISAPVTRTPPVISSTFPNMMFIFFILIIWWLHDRRYLPEPKIRGQDFWTLEFVMFVLMYVLCTYCVVVATNEHAVVGGQVYWWLIFTMGILFAYFANQLQEIFFKSEVFDNSFNSMTNYLFCILVMNLIFTLLETLRGSFEGFGLLWNVAWCGANYLSYIASVKTNIVNSGLTMLVNPVSTALVLAISYPIAALTPDKALVDVFFFFPMIMTSVIMIFFYTIWYKGTRISGRLIPLTGFIDRYSSGEHDLDYRAINLN